MTFRIDEVEYQRVVEMAEREHRSVSAQICHALDYFFGGPAGADLSRMSAERVGRVMERKR